MFQIGSMRLTTGERHEGLVLTWLPDGILIELPQQKVGQIGSYNTSPLSQNHQGRRGTTAGIVDNLLPSLTVFGCSLTAVEAETGPLSDVILPSFVLHSIFLSPNTVPCSFVLCVARFFFFQRPLVLTTCPNHYGCLYFIAHYCIADVVLI